MIFFRCTGKSSNLRSVVLLETFRDSLKTVHLAWGDLENVSPKNLEFCRLVSQALGSCLKLQSIRMDASGFAEHESTRPFAFEDVLCALQKCVHLKKIYIDGWKEILGPPLASFLLSVDGRILDLGIPFEGLKFVCAEAARRGGKLASVGKISGGLLHSCFLGFHLSSCPKEEFDLIFQFLPNLEASSFDFGFSSDKRDASGLVTSFLYNYSGAENARRLHVIYDSDDSTGIMGEMESLLLNVRESLGVVGEGLLNLADLKGLQQDIEKKGCIFHRLSIKFVMGNAECIVKVRSPWKLQFGLC